MEFLAPLMLVGALGLAIPVLIHLIGRQKAKVVRFAAMDLLLGEKRKTARRLRLHEVLLLATRALICLAIPLALAKPFTSCETRGPVVERGPQAAVLIIDNSFAATYAARGGQSLLSRAREQALTILTQLGPEAEVAVVLAAEGALSPTELSRDHIRLRDTISGIDASARPADTTTALRRAAQLLLASHHERRTVFLLSALAATGFRPDEAAWPADSDIELSVVDMTEGQLPANLAITGVSVERDADAGSRGVAVTAELVNFGKHPVEEHGVSLRVAEQVVAQGLVSLRPGERTSKRFLAALPAGSRFADVVVELARDDLAIDNRRYVRTELREEVRVLLVNGDPHTVRHEDELFYIEAALRPGDRADSGTTLTTVTVDELARARLSDFDVVVLANVRAMDAKGVSRLATWVQGGGGLFMTLGGNVNAEAYNKTMQPLLPQTLKDPIAVSHGASGAERAERALRLARWEAAHPIFSVFSKDAPGLREARFDTVMLLGPTTRVSERTVLARYTNDAVALVEARSGQGRLLLFTSSIDRDWNDLAIQPGYLPLMQRAVRYLARKQDRQARDSILVGKSALLPVVADDRRVEVRRPDGSPAIIEGEELEGRKYLRFAETERPGFYRVYVADQRGKLRHRAEADFAVNLDPRGSDLNPIDALQLKELTVTGQAEMRPDRTTHKRRVELWHAIAVGLLMLMLLESILILR
jgi:hypothetical protein